MTKKELLKMLENVGEDEKLTFVVNAYDYNGYPYDAIRDVYKVLGEDVKEVICEYGITRLENK